MRPNKRRKSGRKRKACICSSIPRRSHCETGWWPDPARPPVWVSVVGERSLYPVDCRLSEPENSSPDGDYLYLARLSHSSPRQVGDQSGRGVGRVPGGGVPGPSDLVFPPPASRPACARSRPIRYVRRRAPASELALTLARLLILAGYLYVACPAFAQLVPGTVELNLASGSLSRVFPFAIVLIPIVVTLTALVASVAEFRAGHSSWRAAEVLGTVLVMIIVGYVQVKYAAHAVVALEPRPLGGDHRRSQCVRPGRVLDGCTRRLALRAATNQGDQRRVRVHARVRFAATAAAPEPNRAILKQIDIHRARFDRWFVKPERLLSPFPGRVDFLARCPGHADRGRISRGHVRRHPDFPADILVR